MRILGVATGLILLGLSGLKAVDFVRSADTGEPLVVLAGVVELALALLFLSGTRPAAASLGLILLGLVFSGRTLLGGVEGFAEPGCGCLGPFRPGYLAHLGLSLGLVMLGSLNAWLLPGRGPIARHPSPA